MLNKLIYRRQFILGPAFIKQFSHWTRLKIDQSLHLNAHPDLNVIHRTSMDASLTLLGYILDPDQPEADDQMIIDQILEKMFALKTTDDLFQIVERYGGRWILIAGFKDHWLMLTDPCGYRAVHYSANSNGNGFWSASQPGLFPFVMELQEDPDALEYLDRTKFQHWGNNEYIFPGDRSIYKEIKHLLPNHYLDLVSGDAKRFWPNKYLEPIAFNDCVEESSRFLTKTMEAAARRFELALSITSGRDSRLILASSKKIAEQVYYFTGKYWNLKKRSPDIEIPTKILSKLNLKHHVIHCPNKMEPGFGRIYNANVTPSHDVYGIIAQGFYRNLPKEKVMVKGNAVPIIKGTFHSFREDAEISAALFAKIMKVEGAKFAKDSISKWLIEVQRSIYNLDIFDLYQWEIYEGNWQAMSQLEWDLVVGEIFVPYNNRYLLSLMLGLDKKYRIYPKYQLHEALIKKLWPELMEWPINPATKKHKSLPFRVKRRIKSIFP